MTAWSVHLNGVEVFRDNMPPGSTSYDTHALSQVEAFTFLESAIDPAVFVSGENVVAAEVHNNCWQARILSSICNCSVLMGRPRKAW